jgi:hypothetical protein
LRGNEKKITKIAGFFELLSHIVNLYISYESLKKVNVGIYQLMGNREDNKE